MLWDCLVKTWRSATHEHDELHWLKERLSHVEEDISRLKNHLIIHKLETIVATLDDLVAAAAAEDTKIDSLIALVEALKAKVDAIPGLTPEQQAAIDAAFASISDNPDRIQAAIDANTPAP